LRISDERYRRDLRRLQLAWRFIQLQARTPTIERWTSLSVHRIRRLRRSYVSDTVQDAPLKGVTPFRPEFFFKTPMLRAQAPLLAGFLRAYDVLPEEGTTLEALPTLARGEHFAMAYTQFLAVCPDTEISFEHAVLLLNELVIHEAIDLALCEDSGALMIRDCYSTRRVLCAYCQHRSRRAAAKKETEETLHAELPEYWQRPLF
jgi:hypothetical protein